MSFLLILQCLGNTTAGDFVVVVLSIGCAMLLNCRRPYHTPYFRCDDKVRGSFFMSNNLMRKQCYPCNLRSETSNDWCSLLINKTTTCCTFTAIELIYQLPHMSGSQIEALEQLKRIKLHEAVCISYQLLCSLLQVMMHDHPGP